MRWRIHSLYSGGDLRDGCIFMEGPSTVKYIMAEFMRLFLTTTLDIYEATFGQHDVKARTLYGPGTHAFHEPRRKQEAAPLFANAL